MTKKERRHEALQKIARGYLAKLQRCANKHGLGAWVKDIIAANKRKECEATKAEVMLLARCVNDERISRRDIPKLCGISYRKADEQGMIDRVDNLGAVGTYSKVSALVEREVCYG